MAMTDKKIEEYLAEAVEKNTPDILDALLADIECVEAPIAAPPEEPDKVWKEVRIAENPQAGTPKPAARSRTLKMLVSLAAVFVLIIGGFGVYGNYAKTFAVVGLDVNPGIELSLSSNEKVKSVITVNAEGEDILREMDLTGTDINTACNAIVGSMFTKGYLNDTSNSVLVSVRARDAAKGKALEKKVAEQVNTYLGSTGISPSVMGQYVEDDDELEAFAKANGISEGKAWLIRNLLANGSTRMTEESLLKLSTQELILLGQENDLSDGNSYGSADTSKYISRDKAIEAALAKAGIDKLQASGLKAEFDADDGKIIYEVEFTSGGREYEYDIDAVSGKVIKEESELAEADDPDDNDDDIDDDDDRYDKDDDDDRYDKDDDDDDQYDD